MYRAKYRKNLGYCLLTLLVRSRQHLKSVGATNLFNYLLEHCHVPWMVCVALVGNHCFNWEPVKTTIMTEDSPAYEPQPSLTLSSSPY